MELTEITYWRHSDKHKWHIEGSLACKNVCFQAWGKAPIGAETTTKHPPDMKDCCKACFRQGLRIRIG